MGSSNTLSLHKNPQLILTNALKEIAKENAIGFNN